MSRRGRKRKMVVEDKATFEWEKDKILPENLRDEMETMWEVNNFLNLLVRLFFYHKLIIIFNFLDSTDLSFSSIDQRNAQHHTFINVRSRANAPHAQSIQAISAYNDCFIKVRFTVRFYLFLFILGLVK